MMQVSALYVYPLKSSQALFMQRTWAQRAGFLHDRTWVLVDDEGCFISARTAPQLLRVAVELWPGSAVFRFPQHGAIVALTTQYKRELRVRVWDDTFSAYHGDERLDRWFSELLQRSCRLVWLGAYSTRRQRGKDEPLSFADGDPYLLVNEASLLDINQALAPPVDVRHFRPNIVVTGPYPYEEDDWLKLRIGEVTFAVTRVCTRCSLTTIDIASAVPRADGEPLLTLSRKRQLASGLCFGVNMVACETGQVRVRDEVVVLQMRDVFK